MAGDTHTQLLPSFSDRRQEEEMVEYHLLSFQGHLDEGQVNEGQTHLVPHDF